MAENETIPTPSLCQYTKRNGELCGKPKQAKKQFCRRCNELSCNRSMTPRYRTPASIEPPMNVKACTTPTIAKASELAALPTDSMALSPELNARLTAIESTQTKIMDTLEELKESIEDLNNKLDSETYHRKRGLAICYSKLGIQMPHRMRHESPPSFIVNPIGDIPDSPNYITLPTPKPPKLKLNKRQQKAEEKRVQKAKQQTHTINN